MRYWDASALVATIVDEVHSERLRAIGRADPAVVTWWVTSVECASALIRRERAGEVDREPLATALARLRTAAEKWTQLWPTDDVREQALRVRDVRRHVRIRDLDQAGGQLLRAA